MKKLIVKIFFGMQQKLLKRGLGKDGFSHYQVKKVKNLLVNMKKKNIEVIKEIKKMK